VTTKDRADLQRRKVETRRRNIAAVRHTDAALTDLATTELGLSQSKLARIFGMTQGGLSQRWSLKGHLLKPLERAEIYRRLARRQAATAIKRNALQRLGECRGHTIADVEAFAEHLASCPVCIARTYVLWANKTPTGRSR
jgi:hypothetical protein